MPHASDLQCASVECQWCWCQQWYQQSPGRLQLWHARTKFGKLYKRVPWSRARARGEGRGRKNSEHIILLLCSVTIVNAAGELPMSTSTYSQKRVPLAQDELFFFVGPKPLCACAVGARTDDPGTSACRAKARQGKESESGSESTHRSPGALAGTLSAARTPPGQESGRVRSPSKTSSFSAEFSQLPWSNITKYRSSCSNRVLCCAGWRGAAARRSGRTGGPRADPRPS